MKRLDGLTLNTFSYRFDSNCIHRVRIGKYKPFIYLPEDNYFDKLILKKLTEIELPNMDLYTMHALTKTGVECGFCFDVSNKNPIFGNNYLIGSQNKMNLSIGELSRTKNYMKLKFKLKNCNVYVLNGLATMITVGDSTSDLKEVMDI